MVAAAVMGLIIATLKEWYAGDCRDDLVLLADEALTLIENGIKNFPETAAT